MSPRPPAVRDMGPGLADALGTATEVLDLLGGRSDRSRSLFRGVMAGALVGAALAGMLLRGAAGRRHRPRT